MLGAIEARSEIVFTESIDLGELLTERKVRFSEARRDPTTRPSPEAPNQMIMLLRKDNCPHIVLSLERSDGNFV